MSKNICWWCGDNGNSGEHKFKKSDLKSEFGESFNTPYNRPISFNDKGRQYEMKSPNSKFVKFDKIMCSRCNNERSQNFDLDYTKFVDYIFKNLDKVKSEMIIDLRDLFQSNWRVSKTNIYSYFVKHFCCRIKLSDFEISNKVINFLNKEVDYLEIIHLDFQLKIDLLNLLLTKPEMNGFVSFGSICHYTYADKGLDLIYSHLSRKCFRTELYYSKNITADNFPDLKEFFNSPIIKIRHTHDLEDKEKVTGTFFELIKKFNQDVEHSSIYKYLENKPFKLN